MNLLQELHRRSQRVVPLLALVGMLSLGLGVPGETAIAQAVFPTPPGTYRISAAPAQTAQPSQAMVNTLRQSLSKQTGIPAKKLRVVESSQKTWPDGCLGLAKADELCTQMLVPGWRIVFSNSTQRWTYRTDATGKNYRLETPTQRSQMPVSGTPLGLIQPIPLSDTDLPPKLQHTEVFRVLSSGGLMGQTRQTTLLRDGRMLEVRLNPDGTTTPLGVHRVSAAQMNQLQKVLHQYLPQFDRCNYPAKAGSADFITVTLTSSLGTVRYADSVQSQLPQELQVIVQTWSRMQGGE